MDAASSRMPFAAQVPSIVAQRIIPSVISKTASVSRVLMILSEWRPKSVSVLITSCHGIIIALKKTMRITSHLSDGADMRWSRWWWGRRGSRICYVIGRFYIPISLFWCGGFHVFFSIVRSLLQFDLLREYWYCFENRPFNRSLWNCVYYVQQLLVKNYMRTEVSQAHNCSTIYSYLTEGIWISSNPIAPFLLVFDQNLIKPSSYEKCLEI